MKKALPVALAVLLGALIGLGLLRWLFLSTSELAAWELLWSGFSAGSFPKPAKIFGSPAFAKTLFACFTGAVAGLLVWRSTVMFQTLMDLRTPRKTAKKKRSPR